MWLVTLSLAHNPQSTRVYRPMSSSPRLGFDFVVDKILDVHRASGRTHDTATRGAVTVVSCQLKSSYIEPGGKRAIDNSASDETPAWKRRASSDRPRRVSSVTPSESSFRPSSFTPLPPSSVLSIINLDDVFRPSNGAMLINKRHDTVPYHTAHRSSVMQHVYKRMPPSEIVRVSPGDQIIVVLPAITSKTLMMASSVIGYYRRGFSRVLDRTLRANIDSASRMALVDDAIRSRHIFLRSNAEFWEFECHVKSYPIRELLEMEYSDKSMISTYWDQVLTSVCVAIPQNIRFC